jgi:hypothetical protein
MLTALLSKSSHWRYLYSMLVRSYTKNTAHARRNIPLKSLDLISVQPPAAISIAVRIVGMQLIATDSKSGLGVVIGFLMQLAPVVNLERCNKN